MKKILAILLFATAFFTVSASAQAPYKGRGMSKQTLMDSLKISDAAADSVIAIRQSSMSQMRDIMRDESLSRDQKKEKAKPIKEDMKVRLQKVLTADQLAKLRDIEMGQRNMRREQQ